MVANIYWKFVDDENSGHFYASHCSDTIGKTDRRNAHADRSDHDYHRLLDATGSHTYTCSTHNVWHLKDPLFGSDRRDGSGRGDNHVRETTLNPEASRLIQMTNVPSPMPTYRLSRRVLSDPKVVIALLCMRGTNHDLAGDAWRGRELFTRTTGCIERGDCDFDTVNRSSHKYAVADPCYFDLVQRHVTDGQHFGHAIGRACARSRSQR
jgi:hypothetical protein